MNIKLEFSVDHWRADCLDLPGSPPVGLGETKEMAVACLFHRMMFESTRGTLSEPTNNDNWISKLKREPIIVDGVIWDWPKSYKNNL